MIVDAHQHVWQVGANGFEWPTPDLPALYRNFLPGDWLEEAQRAGVGASILVQSQPSALDTAWLLRLAAETPTILGVVGWADLSASDAPAQVAALAAHPRLCGLRPMLQNLPADDWIASPAVESGLAAMAAHGLALDALIYARHADALERVLRRQPDLRVVIDHGAKPPIAAGAFDDWAPAIERLAAHPQVHCKLSGLLTEAAPGQGEDELRRYVQHLCACFGAERLIWGSDWPVLRLAGDYADWLATADRLTGFTAAQRRAFLGDNARAFYRV